MVLLPRLVTVASRQTVRRLPQVSSSLSRQASLRFASSYHDSSSAHDAEEYPPEGFSAPIWRNTLIAVVVAVAAYRLSLTHAPAFTDSPSEPAHPADSDYPAEAEDESKPFLTRYIAYHMPREGLLREAALQNLEISERIADSTVFLADQQRPPIRRLKYPGIFAQASPHGVQVGSQIDLSDLKVKSDPSVMSKIGQEDDEEEDADD